MAEEFAESVTRSAQKSALAQVAEALETSAFEETNNDSSDNPTRFDAPATSVSDLVAEVEEEEQVIDTPSRESALEEEIEPTVQTLSECQIEEVSDPPIVDTPMAVEITPVEEEVAALVTDSDNAQQASREVVDQEEASAAYIAYLGYKSYLA